MRRFRPLRGRAVLRASLVAVVALAAVALMAFPAVAAPPLEAPVTANLQINVATPTDNLHAGDVVSFDVTSSGAVTISNVETRLCKTGFTTYTAGQFNTSGGTGVRCVQQFEGVTPGTGITGGNFLTPTGPTGATYRIDPEDQPPATQDTVSYNFKAGTGFVSWLPNGGVAQSMFCDSDHPCDMVVKVESSSGTVFYIQTLTYAVVAPAAPVLQPATAGNGTVSLDWNDVSTATSYELCVNTAPATAACASPIPVTPSTLVGLAQPNFVQKWYTVRALNSAGTGPLSNEVSATPLPPGATSAPDITSAIGGDGTVDLAWTSTGAPNYQVRVFQSDCTTTTAFGPYTTAGLTLTVPPSTPPFLTNGTTYCFSVRGDFGGGNFSPADTANAKPGAAAIYQTINVTRPEGVLVISQRCANLPYSTRLPNFTPSVVGDFDPTNSDAVNAGDLLADPTRCTVNLSGPRTEHIVNGVITSNGRTGFDGVVTSGSTSLASGQLAMQTTDIGQLVTGTGIQEGTRITAVASGVATLSLPATASFDDAKVTIVGRTITGAPGAFAGQGGKEISGPKIPGGSTIGTVGDVGGVGFADINQTTNGIASTANSVRIYDEAATPARLITQGPQAGKYFEATGRIAQFYVVDYRSTNAGWTAQGQVSDFCDGSGGPDTGAPAHLNPAPAPDVCQVGDPKFSGNNLGWTPRLRFFQGGAGDSFNPAEPMVVTQAGSLNPVGSGLADAPKTLASTTAGAGLGVARIDADLRLWIPVEVDSGAYQASLTLNFL